MDYLDLPYCRQKMMLRLSLIALLVLAGSVAFSQEITFVLRADATQICLSDSLKISYRISGYSQLKAITKLDEMPGFELIQGPGARQTQNIQSNSRGGYDTSRSYEVAYTLRPLATGRFTLPALTVTTADGRTLPSNTLEVTVVRDCKARIRNTSFDAATATTPVFKGYIHAGDTSRDGKLHDELRGLGNSLLHQGEVITEPRNVYLTFYCKTADSRTACMQWAQQQGFRIPGNADLDGADKNGEYLFWIARKEVAIPDSLFPMVRQIVHALEDRFKSQVRYGWATAQQLKVGK